jgi:hypothetical protein
MEHNDAQRTRDVKSAARIERTFANDTGPRLPVGPRQGFGALRRKRYGDAVSMRRGFIFA